jgi:molecular chaperone DnaJ
MAGNKQPKKRIASSTQTYLVVLAEILLVLLILLILPPLVEAANPKKRSEQEMRNLRSSCFRETCNMYIPEESANCVYACISPSCYQQIFGQEPLEDGEVDVERSRQFDACLRDEFRTYRQRKRQRELYY